MIFVSGKRCRMWTKNQATQSLRLDLEKVAKKWNGVGRGAAVAVRAGVCATFLEYRVCDSACGNRDGVQDYPERKKVVV